MTVCIVAKQPAKIVTFTTKGYMYINEPVATTAFILLSAFKKNRREKFQDKLRRSWWIFLKQRLATLILVIIPLV